MKKRTGTLLTVFVTAATAIVAAPAKAFEIRCLQGVNPCGTTNCVSNPTLWAVTEWDSWDLISMDTVYMTSIAYGPSCPDMGCVLLVPDSAYRKMSAFPDHRRLQILGVFLGGGYTLSGSARGFLGETPKTPLQICQVTGLAAPARCSER